MIEGDVLVVNSGSLVPHRTGPRTLTGNRRRREIESTRTNPLKGPVPS